MKKILLLLVVSFLLLAPMYSQVIQYDIKVKYNHEASGTTADITVTVKMGNPNFTYYLMTNDPIKGNVLLKSYPTNKKSFTFKELKPGKYFVKIEYNNGMQAGKSVEIVEDQI